MHYICGNYYILDEIIHGDKIKFYGSIGIENESYYNNE